MKAKIDVKGSKETQNSSPLTNDTFCKVWCQYLPTMRIMKGVSDFCDTYAKLKNDANTMVDFSMKTAVLQTLLRHCEDAKEEFRNYRELKDEARLVTKSIHLVVDFPKKSSSRTYIISLVSFNSLPSWSLTCLEFTEAPYEISIYIGSLRGTVQVVKSRPKHHKCCMIVFSYTKNNNLL